MRLNFGDITSKVFGFNLTVEFEFSSDTFQTLIKILSTFPNNYDEKLRPNIALGDSVKNIELDQMKNLLKVCQNKITINLDGIDFEKIILRSKHSKLLEVGHDNISEEDSAYLFKLIDENLYELFEVFLKLNSKLVDVKKMMADKEEEGITFA